MTRRIRTTTAAAIATLVTTGAVSVGATAPAQAGTGASPQADERRSECVREKQVAGLPVRSLLCVTVTWDETAGTTTVVAKLRVTNGTKSNRSMRVRFRTRPGVFQDSDIRDRSLAPASAVTYSVTRTVERYLDHPVAKSRVVLYSGETDDYTVPGKTIRATP